MKASIVTIGDEILIGQITDTNSGYIAKSLDNIGIEVIEMLSIADDKNAILDAFAKFQNTVDLVIITGGLGPTKDDITKKTFCDYFDDELVMNESVLAHVTNLIEHHYKRPITDINKEQGLVPSKATVLHNDLGTAPGMWMQKGNTVFISLPGVPYEMKHIIQTAVLPKLISEFDRPYIIHKTILTYGVGESLLAEKIEDWENNLPEFIKLAYLPNPGRVRLRLSARGKDKTILENAIAENVESLSAILGDIIAGYDDTETLEFVLGKLLTASGKTLATAESCTGGKIAQLITSIPGASNYFKGSVVCYNKEVKINVVGVKSETIEKHSVVSAEVVKEMAFGIQKLMKSDYAIAVTGNAGPTSDETDNKVGTVFIGICAGENFVIESFDFGQPRGKVIDRTVNKSLEMLRAIIIKSAK